MTDCSIFLANANEIIPIVAIVGGLVFGFLLAMSGMLSTHLNIRQREHTKREIAAYIAEGSMTPEEGERLIRAEAPSNGKKGSC